MNYIIYDLQVMTKLVSVVKHLNVNNRIAFQVLLEEWIKKKTLDNACIQVLWLWFTKTSNIPHDDRIVATVILSMLAK